MTQEFLEASKKSVMFDLAGGNKMSIEEWRSRERFEACDYCSWWKGIYVPRVSDPRYFKDVAKAIRLDRLKK